MNINITACHTKLTQAISSYIHKKLEKIQRHMDVLTRIQVILSVQKNRHIAEFVIHAPGENFKTEANSTDLYSAIDLAIDKLDKHVRRTKDKRADKSKGRGSKRVVLDADPKTKASKKAPSIKDTKVSPIEDISGITLEQLSVEAALDFLQDNDLPFLPFINVESGIISILYRKSKKAFGLLETEE